MHKFSINIRILCYLPFGRRLWQRHFVCLDWSLQQSTRSALIGLNSHHGARQEIGREQFPNPCITQQLHTCLIFELPYGAQMGTVRRLNILCPNLVQPNVLRTGSISEFPFHCAPTNLMFWWAIMRYCHTNTISYIIVSILQISDNKLTKGEGRKMSLNPVYCTLKSWG